jgi:hypothetical protein
MLTPYRGGSSAKVNDESDIERTPEYQAFILGLADFHRQRGCETRLPVSRQRHS